MTEQKILPAPLDRDELLTLVRLALDEDLRYGPDITSTATVPADAVAKASVVSRSSGTVAGIDVGLLVLDEVIARVTTRSLIGWPTELGLRQVNRYSPLSRPPADFSRQSARCSTSSAISRESPRRHHSGSTPSPALMPKCGTAERHCPDCVLCRNMQSTWAEASTTVWDWVTRR